MRTGRIEGAIEDMRKVLKFADQSRHREAPVIAFELLKLLVEAGRWKHAETLLDRTNALPAEDQLLALACSVRVGLGLGNKELAEGYLNKIRARWPDSKTLTTLENEFKANGALEVEETPGIELWTE